MLCELVGRTAPTALGSWARVSSSGCASSEEATTVCLAYAAPRCAGSASGDSVLARRQKRKRAVRKKNCRKTLDGTRWTHQGRALRASPRRCTQWSAARRASRRRTRRLARPARRLASLDRRRLSPAPRPLPVRGSKPIAYKYCSAGNALPSCTYRYDLSSTRISYGPCAVPAGRPESGQHSRS